MNLLRLARLTGKTDYEAKAAQMLQIFSDSVSQAPGAHTDLKGALDFSLGPSYDVGIVGKRQNQDTKAMLNALKSRVIPNKVVLLQPIEDELPEIIRYVEFTKDLSSLGGKATAYAYHNYQCELPTTQKEEMLRSLDALT